MKRKTDKMAENGITASLHTDFAKTLTKQFSRAISEYRLLENGDSVAVCISGGKDSMLMAALFDDYQRYSGIDFSVKYLVMNPGYSAENMALIRDNAALFGIEINEYKTEIFKHTANTPDNPCFLCSKMRRGHLYKKAQELGCRKIALGHHFDDVIESILMGMLYGGQTQTMLPRLKSQNYAGMELIRPMYFIRERDVIKWGEANKLRFAPCGCALAKRECDSKRAEVKRLIERLAAENPQVEQNIFRAVHNVRLDRIISYKDEGGEHSFLERFD